MDKTELKEELEKKLIRIKSEIDDLKELTKPVAPDDSIGRITRMDAINNKSVNEAILRKKEAQLIGIQYSLSIIDKDHFGICTKCNNNIENARLLLIPESKLCISCARG